jgi:DNA-binding transcriptional LysR family regulator
MEQYDLENLRGYIAVVESASFVKAAAKLEVSTAAISRRVSALEQALGVLLISRTTRRIDVTDAGKRFYDDAVAVLQLLGEAEERARAGRESVAGLLRVAAPLSFGIQKIAPLLPAFMHRHPELKVQLLLDDRYTDLHAEGIDLAIRIGSLRDSSLIATRIETMERHFFASPGYLAERGEPLVPDDLKRHSCLHYSGLSMREEWAIAYGESATATELHCPLSVNNAEVLREAAIQGIGITMLPRFVVEDALADGRLRQVLAGHSPAPLGLYAVRTSRQFTPARLRLFIEFLQASFSAGSAVSHDRGVSV